MNVQNRTTRRQQWSIDEFLNWEEQQPERWELRRGGPWRMMVGAPHSHAKIVGNLRAALDRQLRGGPCDVYSETFKVLVGARIYYPDILVGCGPIVLDATFTESPSVLAEVMSPSSEKIDPFEKLAAYLTIPSLQVYIIVRQVPRQILVHRPKLGLVTLDSPGSVFSVDGLGVTLAFDDVFEGLPEDLTGGDRDEQSVS